MSPTDGGAALKVMATPDKAGKEKLDIRALMAEIRARVKADSEAGRDGNEPYKPAPADGIGGSRKAGELLHSEELRHLNQYLINATTLNLDAIASPRSGLLGKFAVMFKRKVLGIVWEHLFKDFWDYQKNVVRFLNDVSKYVDARDASNFWELIRKIDYDVSKALERIERIADEQTASRHSSERSLGGRFDAALKEIRVDLEKLATSSHKHQDALQTLDSVVRGLEGIIPGLSEERKSIPVVKAQGAEANGEHPDFSYLLLENRFRGSEDEITSRLSIYPALFKESPGPVLEVGSGRGELQRLFKAQGILSYGVDCDEAMVKVCLEHGVDTRHGDGISHLRSLSDQSLGGVIAIQVVEHLERRLLEEFISLCRKKIAPGGTVVFETIDPRSVLALSSNYFRDPTHVWPLHPDTLAYAMSLGGLSVVDVKNLSPVPQEALLKKIPIDEYFTPRWALAVERMNRNTDQLNALLYGFQDYCVVGKVCE